MVREIFGFVGVLRAWYGFRLLSSRNGLYKHSLCSSHKHSCPSSPSLIAPSFTGGQVVSHRCIHWPLCLHPDAAGSEARVHCQVPHREGDLPDHGPGALRHPRNFVHCVELDNLVTYVYHRRSFVVLLCCNRFFIHSFIILHFAYGSTRPTPSTSSSLWTRATTSLCYFPFFDRWFKERALQHARCASTTPSRL